MNMQASLSLLNVLTDCDGVLLDWSKAFRLYAEWRLGRPLDPSQHKDFDVSIWLDLSAEETRALIDDFNDGDGGYFSKLEPLPGAIEALAAAHAQGRAIDVITSCSTKAKVVSDRKQNLTSVFGKIFGEIHCIDMSASKEDLLRQYPRSIWIEDKYQNAVLGAECGHSSYLIKATYNERFLGQQHAAPIEIVEGWGCIRAHASLH